MAAPVWEGNRFRGVVAATISLRGDLGHPLGDDMRTVVLTAPLDLNERDKPLETASRREYTVVLHPALQATNLSMRLPDAAMRAVRDLAPGGAFALRTAVPATESMNDAYTDPFGGLDGRWAGRWLAGFAPVGNTECIVIVQQRRSDTLGLVRALARRFALWGGLAVLAVASGAWAGWRATQKR